MNVSNQAVAKILQEISEYLAMQDVPWKPRAYEKAAAIISALEESVSVIYKKGDIKALQEIPGIGVSIAQTIEEFLETGRVKYYDKLKKKTPVDLASLRRVEGLGPKSIKKLYQKLGIKNLADLEHAAKKGKIHKLEGFGAKTEENALKGIEFLKKSGGRFTLGNAMPVAREIEARIRGLAGAERVIVAGSIRRRKETIGDFDILAIAKRSKPVMDYFVAMPEAARVRAKGETKSSIALASGIDVDLRVVLAKSYGAALNYFTGSKDHNVALRQIAIKKGYTLNEYGLYRQRPPFRRGFGGQANSKGHIVAGKTEEEIYTALGMDYIDPEMRENTGEIELAKIHKLPHLIDYNDLKGDLQVQTNWTDGSDSIEAMAKAALAHGLTYIAITDHTKRLAMTHGLDEKRIIRQMAEIDRINKKFHASGFKFHILKGTECDILKDGSLDLNDATLAKLDIVGVSVHSYFNLGRKEQTERIIRAMRNPHADILFHPTGRIIQKRAPYDVDIDEIIKTAKATGTILEIDAYPDRLDLKDEHIRKCVEAGVKMAIDSDAHAPVHFPFLEYGIAQARRGWAEKKDIINAWSLEKMLGMLKQS